MQIAAIDARHAYEIGDEVVVRLDGVEVRDANSGAPRATGAAWTIAEITGAVTRNERPGYVFRFREDDAVCTCIADETAIEGLA